MVGYNVTGVTFMANWLLLHYNVTAKPSAGRVYIWRKLKRLGAVLVQNAIWILPDTPRTAEHFQWLVAEIQEMNGDALLWRSNLILGLQEDVLVQKFQEQVDKDYAELLRQLKRKNSHLAELSQQYQQIQTKDYFGSGLGRQVREQLLARRSAAE
jgi:ChrB-like protein